MTEPIPSSTSLWVVLGMPGIPLLSSFICFIISRKFAWVAPVISSVLLLITLTCATLLIFRIGHNETLEYSWQWFSIDQKTIHAGILLDNKSIIMALVVALVSFLVHLFSIGYMADDKALTRYFGMLGFFTFSMMGLVMSSNLLVLFCFWELVGFCSYRLIGHWHEKPEAAQAATKAFILNRVGDAGFLIGLMILWSWSGNHDIIHLNTTPIPSMWLTTAGICIFVGVIGKSAQFPLLNWLPDAMEGPTPISALIHAATMVAAGVYLLIRIENVFTEDALTVIAVIGVLTAILGAIGATFQYDIKKILAYSTISQLGFMVMAIGAGSSSGGYMHLLHHAFFKAGLFLGAGAIIHALHQSYHHHDNGIDVQDIRNISGLRKKLPVTFLSFMICAAALAGLPLTSGFVSKEIILTQMNLWVAAGSSWKWLVLCGAWVVTFLTPFYTFRMVWYIFFRKSIRETDIAEVPVVMLIPMVFLSLGSLAIIITFDPFHIASFINVLTVTYQETNTIIAMLSTLLVVVALVTAFLVYKNEKLLEVNKFTSPHFYLDWVNVFLFKLVNQLSDLAHQIDRKVIDKVIHGLTYLQVTIAHIAGWSDRHLVDGLVNGVAYSAKGIGSLTRSIANGKIQSYLLWALASLLIFILWILY